MTHYKDSNNKLHFLDDASFSHLLPSDCVEITDEEAEILRQPAPSTVAERKATKLAEIKAIEANAYMRRGQREDWLIWTTEKFTAAGYTHEQVYAVNHEYKRVYDENVLSTQLRAEMKAIV